MEQNAPEIPIQPEPDPGLQLMWLFRIGYALVCTAMICVVGAFNEINTEPREQFIFDLFAYGAVAFGVPGVISLLAGTFLDPRPKSTPRPRRFHFSLRTLFVVMTILAISLGYLGWAMNWKRQRHEFIATHNLRLIPEDESSRQANLHWSLRLLGERGYLAILFYDFSQEERKAGCRLFPEAFEGRNYPPAD
jgi:hypothetical protein